MGCVESKDVKDETDLPTIHLHEVREQAHAYRDQLFDTQQQLRSIQRQMSDERRKNAQNTSALLLAEAREEASYYRNQLYSTKQQLRAIQGQLEDERNMYSQNRNIAIHSKLEETVQNYKTQLLNTQEQLKLVQQQLQDEKNCKWESMLSDRQISYVVKSAKELEQVLVQYGASGEGLGEKIDSLKEKLPKGLARHMCRINETRKKLTQDATCNELSADEFNDVCDSVILCLCCLKEDV